jgi:hypothetical protein
VGSRRLMPVMYNVLLLLLFSLFREIVVRVRAGKVVVVETRVQRGGRLLVY